MSIAVRLVWLSTAVTFGVVVATMMRVNEARRAAGRRGQKK